MMRNKLVSSFSFISLLFLAGCMQSPAESLKRFPKIVEADAHVTQRDGVRLLASALTSQDCTQYFKHDYLEYGIQPIAVRIENTTADVLTLDPAYVDLELLTGTQAARPTHWDTYNIGMSLLGVGLYIGVPFFAPLAWLIPASPAVAYNLYRTNRKITKRMKYHVFHQKSKPRIIAPFGHTNLFLFVPMSNLRPLFDLSVFNETTRHLTRLTVDLRKQI